MKLWEYKSGELTLNRQVSFGPYETGYSYMVSEKNKKYRKIQIQNDDLLTSEEKTEAINFITGGILNA